MPGREHLFLPMRDGVRLHATLYTPDGKGPWPALLEALPYRKDDLTGRDRSEYERYAGAGYAMLRLDVRGTGTSEGPALDEYPPVELDDLNDVIAWLASRPWSNGNVGMFGRVQKVVGADRDGDVSVGGKGKPGGVAGVPLHTRHRPHALRHPEGRATHAVFEDTMVGTKDAPQPVDRRVSQ